MLLHPRFHSLQKRTRRRRRRRKLHFRHFQFLLFGRRNGFHLSFKKKKNMILYLLSPNPLSPKNPRKLLSPQKITTPEANEMKAGNPFFIFPRKIFFTQKKKTINRKIGISNSWKQRLEKEQKKKKKKRK